jgi:outer membrane protein assembly factor BamB
MVPFPDLHYLWLSGNSLWLAPPPPVPEAWRVDTGDSIPGIAMWPVQYGQTTILSPGLYPRIIAVDSASGKDIWEDSREFASLPILFRGTLYALTKDAALVALDPTSGLELARAEFSPSQTEETTRSHIYARSASDEVLVVYFGDSCQMFAFSPSGA